MRKKGRQFKKQLMGIKKRLNPPLKKPYPNPFRKNSTAHQNIDI